MFYGTSGLGVHSFDAILKFLTFNFKFKPDPTDFKESKNVYTHEKPLRSN